MSHHDLMRLFERALRRTGLPLKMSEGFNPRPQLSFPTALALGIESRDEVFEIELVEWVSPSQVAGKLKGELPEGIGIRSVKSVGYGEKAEIKGTRFSVRMANIPEDLAARLDEFEKASEVFVERRGKSGGREVNVRAFVRSIRLEGSALDMDLAVTPAGSVRPEEVLKAILKAPSDSLAPLEITRLRLDLAPPPRAGER